MKKLFFNYILYFSCLVFVCIIGISNVFAFEYTYTVVGDIYSHTEQLVSTTYGSAPYNNPRNSGYAFGDVFQVDYVVSNYTFNANTNYQLESHLPNQVFTNVNAYKVSGLNGEACMISYANSILNNDHYPRWAFQCPHQTNTITITIYNSNNQNLWSGTGIFNWSSAVLWSSSTAMTSSDTNSIINNQNQNTQDIINNQNSNNKKIIDSNSVCKELSIKDAPLDGFIGIDGIFKEQHGYNKSTDFISLNQVNKIVLLKKSNTNKYACFYSSDKTTINCYDTSSLSDNSEIPIPSNASYFRSNFEVSDNLPIYSICSDGNQALNDSINDDDTTGATSEASDFFSSFTTNTFGLTSIITAPLNLVRSVLSSTCTTLQLPLPYLDNKKLELPCMTSIYSQYFGTFFTIYQTITYGIIAYWVCVRIFNQVKDFKNPEHDEIEVMDL